MINKPKPEISRHTRLVRVLFTISMLLAVLELYRFIHYGVNWQFLLTITTPLKVWCMFNLAFIMFILAIPVFLLFVTRHRDAPIWIGRYLLVSVLAGVIRSLVLRSTPFAESLRLGLVFQLSMLILLLWVLIKRKDWLTANETG